MLNLSQTTDSPYSITSTLRVMGAAACLGLAPIQQSLADCPIGNVMFRDSLYGSIIGAGVTGLVLLADQNANNIPKNLAIGSLIGMGVGASIGVAELYLSSGCSRDAAAEISRPPLLSIRPSAFIATSPAGKATLPLSIQDIGYGFNFFLTLP